MIYIVGGASRSGKSILSNRMNEETGVSCFPLDALMMGLYRGAEQLGIHPEAGDLSNADAMWPIVRAMIDNLLFDGRDFLVEGSCLRPSAVAPLINAKAGRARACFLGYPDSDPAQKADDITKRGGGPNDWLSDKPREFIEGHVRASREFSGILRSECREAGLRFFDTGVDFEAALGVAADHLLGR